MNTIKTNIKVGVYHTNFPISLNAVKNFKNPLGKVSFSSTYNRETIRDILKLNNPSIY